MKPYYEHAGITIYHGDCREVLPSLVGVDAVVTDPPYGIAYKGGGGGNLIHSSQHRRKETVLGDDVPFDPTPLLRFERVALFGSQHYYSVLPPGGSFHVWDKRGEYKPVHTADFDTVWVNHKEPGRIHRCVWRGLCREVENRDKIKHPTQKPLRVMHWAMDMARVETANVVVDPYMGSGTTLVACRERGIVATGIEACEEYCEIAANRLAQEVLFA